MTTGVHGRAGQRGASRWPRRVLRAVPGRAPARAGAARPQTLDLVTGMTGMKQRDSAMPSGVVEILRFCVVVFFGGLGFTIAGSSSGQRRPGGPVRRHQPRHHPRRGRRVRPRRRRRAPHRPQPARGRGRRPRPLARAGAGRRGGRGPRGPRRRRARLADPAASAPRPHAAAVRVRLRDRRHPRLPPRAVAARGPARDLRPPRGLRRRVDVHAAQAARHLGRHRRAHRGRRPRRLPARPPRRHAARARRAPGPRGRR